VTARPIHFILALVLPLLGGCSGEQAPPPLRVAINVWPGYDTLWLAEQLGFTAAEGVKVRIMTTDGLGASRRLFKLGEADVIGGTLVELISTALIDGRKSRAVALLDVSLGPDVILGRPGLASVRELRGRRIGVEPGTSDILLLASALRAHGIEPGEVREVFLTHPAKLGALAAGEVDAVCSYPPEAAETVRRTGARVLFSSADAPGAIIDVLITDAETIRTRSRELAALVRANQRAIDALRTDPAARRLVAERGRLTTAELEQQLAGMQLPELASQPSRFGRGGTVHLATEEAVRALRRYGAISREPAPEELLEEGILRAAATLR
jgi:NitT/TauT family transport system substrate-binding protein